MYCVCHVHVLVRLHDEISLQIINQHEHLGKKVELRRTYGMICSRQDKTRQDICFQNYMYRTNFYFSQFSKAFTLYMLFKDKYFGQNRKQFISSFFRKMSDILKFKYIMTVTEKNHKSHK